MSQTDTRPGFKLPWTAERSDAGQPGDAPGDAPTEEPAMETTGEPAGDGTAQPADTSVAVDDPTAAEEHMTTDMTDATAITPARRPTKFMADLSRAMQTAAESSRDETMTRFASDAKVAVEEIRTGSADEAAGLRRRADDDVAAVREWSKTEIARIREETDARIVARKAALDGEMDAFAAIIEARVERVNKTVTEFEAEMSEFFERLLAEQDPTRIATMAQAMPDPPDLSAIAATVTEAAPRAVPTADPVEPDAGPAAQDDEAPTAVATPAEGETETPTGTEVQAESEPVFEAQAEGEPVAADAPVGSVEGEPEPAVMPDPDFAAAEAEAASFSGDLDDDDGLTKLAESSDAPADGAAAAGPAARANGRVTTRVVVLGLVSVASIATFKRSLGRVSGVSAIGVASGPDGEFVFTVSHDAGLALGEAITALPGFDATISNQTSDGLEVAAHDPDAGD